MYNIKNNFSANSLKDVLEILENSEKAKIIAGGTDLLVKLKDKVDIEQEFISIGDLKDLVGISIDKDGTIVIKAATKFVDIINHPIILEHIPFFAEACNVIGSHQIRNVATIGGNICNGAVSADVVPSLLVLEAKLHILNSKGIKSIVDINNFYKGPGKTILKEKEILTEIHIEKINYVDYGFSYYKFGKRNAMEIATLGCGVAIKINKENDFIEDFRIAFSVAAPTARRCISIEKLLIGRKVSDETINLIRPENIEELNPRDSWRASKSFRLQLIKEVGRRTTKNAIKDGDENYVKEY